MEKTSVRWKNPDRKGAFKSKLALTFEEAHDKKARELVIQNTEQIREA